MNNSIFRPPAAFERRPLETGRPQTGHLGASRSGRPSLASSASRRSLAPAQAEAPEAKDWLQQGEKTEAPKRRPKRWASAGWRLLDDLPARRRRQSPGDFSEPLWHELWPSAERHLAGGQSSSPEDERPLGRPEEWPELEPSLLVLDGEAAPKSRDLLDGHLHAAKLGLSAATRPKPRPVSLAEIRPEVDAAAPLPASNAEHPMLRGALLMAYDLGGQKYGDRDENDDNEGPKVAEQEAGLFGGESSLAPVPVSGPLLEPISPILQQEASGDSGATLRQVIQSNCVQFRPNGPARLPVFCTISCGRGATLVAS